MDKIVKIIYKDEPRELKITYADKNFDISKIKNIPIEKWLFPFCSKGFKWNGLYEELKRFTAADNFIIHFDGDNNTFDILKYYFSQTNVNILSLNNVVTILYSENPFVTKIAINGNIFDTSCIQNRSIEEWINPINISGLKWDGIFEELKEFLGVDVYTINFIGDEKLIKFLIDGCPENVDVFYRAPKFANKLNKTKNREFEDISSRSVNIPKVDIKSISSAKKKTFENMSTDISDVEIEENKDKIPIKNSFIRKNIMTLCALLTIILAFLPFASFTAELSGEQGNTVGVSGFETLFGIQEIKIGSNSSIFALLMFIAPILVIAINYIKPLKSFRKIIVVGAPAIGVIGEIITYFDISNLFKTFANAQGAELKTSLGIGFFLILVSYILTFVLGLVIYNGVEIPIKKK